MKLASDMQIKNLLVESDSAIAINLLSSTSTDVALHPLATIISNCHAYLRLFEICQIHHVHRECNSVADALAKDSCNLSWHYIILQPSLSYC